MVLGKHIFLKGKQRVEEASTTLENELLQEFLSCWKCGDYEGMKEKYRELEEFNGAHSCIRHYINNLGMFFDAASLKMDLKQAKHKTEGDFSHIELFFTRNIESCKSQFDIIDKVFQSPALVKHQLVLRVFEQRIRMFVERLLEDWKQGVDEFLPTLATAYLNTIHFVDFLKSYPQISSLNFNGIVDGLYYSYKEDYLQYELSHLEKLYSNKSEVLVEELEAWIEASNSGGRGREEEVVDRTREEGPMGNMSAILEFIHSNLYSAHRASLLSPKDNLGKALFLIFSTLLSYLGHKYMEVGLDRCLSALFRENTSWEREMSDLIARESNSTDYHIAKTHYYFHFIHLINQIVISLHHHMVTNIVSEIGQTQIYHSQCYELKNGLCSQLEDKISSGLEQCLAIIYSNFARLLRLNQNRNDFRIRDGDYMLHLLDHPTHASSAAIAYLQAQTKLINQFLDGDNQTNVLLKLNKTLPKYVTLCVVFTHDVCFTVCC